MEAFGSLGLWKLDQFKFRETCLLAAAISDLCQKLEKEKQANTSGDMWPNYCTIVLLGRYLDNWQLVISGQEESDCPEKATVMSLSIKSCELLPRSFFLGLLSIFLIFLFSSWCSLFPKFLYNVVYFCLWFHVYFPSCCHFFFLLHFHTIYVCGLILRYSFFGFEWSKNNWLFKLQSGIQADCWFFTALENKGFVLKSYNNFISIVANLSQAHSSCEWLTPLRSQAGTWAEMDCLSFLQTVVSASFPLGDSVAPLVSRCGTFRG